MHTLADRLNQDPFLGEAIHRILTNVSAIRSLSEILTSVDDVEAAHLHRFHAILSAESTRLSAAAPRLPTFFATSGTATLPTHTAEQAEDFIPQHHHPFHPLPS